MVNELRILCSKYRKQPDQIGLSAIMSLLGRKWLNEELEIAVRPRLGVNDENNYNKGVNDENNYNN